jgi:preprotein translocase subunit YajC
MTPPQIAVIAQASGPAAPVGAPAGGAGAPAGNPSDALWNMFVLFGVPLLVLYFIFMRPAQKQEKLRRAALAAMKKNDDVLVSGGILGKVIDIKEKPGGLSGEEDVIVVRVDDKTRLSVLRSAIARVLPSGAEEKDSEPSK